MTYIEFKQGEKFASKGADTSPMHESFKDCGYLLESTDIVIDIDNLPKETIEKMIEEFNIKTQIVWTKRGCHLYFEKPKGMKVKKDSLNALGVEFEYKDSKNTPNGITIKRDGVMRTIKNHGVREPLPEFLQPMNKVESLLGLGDGDKTDSRLYSHKFKIMKVSNWRQVIKFINQHIIAYPFEDKDIERIMRDEQLRTKDGQITEYDVAMTLNHELKAVLYKKELYTYDGIRYVNDDDEVQRVVADKLRGQSTRYQDEVIKQMKRYAPKVTERKGGFDIKFKNGILRDGEFYEVDSDEFTLFYIPYNYIPNAEPVGIVDYFLNNLSKGHDGQSYCEDYKNFILEIIAHCLITNIDVKQNKNFQRVFFFAGNGGNGKGALFKIIRTLLGEGNYKSNKLEKFSDERYVYGMKSKLANLGDDIEDVPIKPNVMSNLKSMSAYEEIELRKLFGMPVNETIGATQMFTTNHILKSFEKGHAWERRVVWCPIYVTPERKFENFYGDITSTESIEYLLSLVMTAYFRLLEKGDFTHVQKVADFTEDYHKTNNSCLTFLSFTGVDDIEGRRPPEVYGDYQVWCEENGRHLQSSKILRETIQTVHDMTIGSKRVQGKVADVYKVKPKV